MMTMATVDCLARLQIHAEGCAKERVLRVVHGEGIAGQQQVIPNMVTVDSEQRLGETLLQLARTLGKKEARGIRIELQISHEELSEMVGTTRPRITLFIQRFQDLGLIEKSFRRSLIIQKEKLASYLAVRAAGHVWALRDHSLQNRPVIRRRLFPKLAERQIESIRR